MQQRHSLAHHVRSHQCTVSIIVLQERNERGCNRSYLLRRHIHEVDLGRRNDGEVGILTALYDVTDKRSVIIQRGITLTDDIIGFVLSCQIDDLVIIEIGNSILHLTVRCLDKAKLIDLSIDTKRRNQTDVRTFRTLNRTEATIVSVMYVTNLKSCTLT